MSNPFDFINKICLIQWMDRGYGDEYNSGGGGCMDVGVGYLVVDE